MATVVIGWGLLRSTVQSLLVVPVIFTHVDDLLQAVRRLTVRLAAGERNSAVGA